MKRVASWLGGLLICCQSFALLAQPIMVEVNLAKIERIQATEENGDELYFNVTEYSSLERPRHYQVPNFPTHWLSEHLKNVKDVNLWEKKLAQNEAVEVILSLVERDVPTWNVDDLIGYVKLKIRNNNGKMEHIWSVPLNADTALAKGSQDKFVLTGDYGKYIIELKAQKVKLEPNKTKGGSNNGKGEPQKDSPQ